VGIGWNCEREMRKEMRNIYLMVEKKMVKYSLLNLRPIDIIIDNVMLYTCREIVGVILNLF
jgi:hypothetical protein